MIKGIQVVGILVSVYLVLDVYKNYRQGNYGLRKTLFLILLWSGVGILFINTSLMNLVLPILMTENIIFTVLVMGELVIFLFISNLNQQISRVEKKMEIMVQNIAVDDFISNYDLKMRKDDE